MGGIIGSPAEMSEGRRWTFRVTGKQALTNQESEETDQEERVVRGLWNLPTFKD